ncbi:MAG TPA: acyloxyacyl hydrolase [Rhodospirillales bacterium]|nr:acyloxyacyl hydrolase [Rhodospirillales bacterium]
MRPFLLCLAGLVGLSGSSLALLLGAVSAQAATSGAIYDMQRMLSEPHPFAGPPVPPAASPVAPSVAPSAPPTVAPRAAPRRAVQAPPPRTATKPRPTARQGGTTGALWDVISEVRTGLLAHDQGPFSSNKEDGVDINLEVIFVTPEILDIIWRPRPHIGLIGNSSGDTSQAYVGLGWEWDFWRTWFAGFTLGGAIHDGKNTTKELDRKELGCRVLFHESIDFGYRFSKRHSVMAQLSHSSNAKLCSENEGLETIGIRYGYQF